MATVPGRGARNLDELGRNFGALAEGAPGKDYRPHEPREGDVFITSWGKSGTTMTQQMFHQIRMVAATGSTDMDFDDISRMTPWEDTAAMLDFDMTTPQRAHPRGFKSHREYERLPEGARYVVTLRDPYGTYASFHRFFDGWHIERGAFSLEEFFPVWMMGGPGGTDYFTHLLSWYERRGEPDTLLVTYRWACDNHEEMIRRLARFMGIEPTEDLVALVASHTTREFMAAHKDRFDDAMVCAVMEERLGIPADSESSKVHAKGSNAAALPESVTAQIDAMWAERVEPATGHKDFASLAAEVETLAG